MNFSYQECKLKCIGGSLPQTLFGDYQLSRTLIHIHWWDLKQNLFGDFQLSRILINLHWWHLNTKAFRRFSAIRKTYWHALVWHKHKTVSAIFSFQEHLLRCIGGTLTQNLFGDFKLSKCILICIGGTLPQNLFGDFQLSRIPIHMHWWDLNKKSFRRFSAIKNIHEHTLVEP